MKKIRRFLEFMKEEKGIGVVEVILILVVSKFEVLYRKVLAYI